jgi:hypothetical protein
LSTGKLETLARMANPIGAFYAARPGPAATQFLRAYRTPHGIGERVETLRAGLSPTAARTVDALRRAGYT